MAGGTGKLGLILAEHLARNYGAGVVLAGRELPPQQQQQQQIRQLAELGGRAAFVAADLTCQSDVEALLAAAKARFGPINGVIHAAGTFSEGYVAARGRAETVAVIDPKVRGALWLDRATRDEPLDFFVMFSSSAAVFGNAGQADYAYANAFLDGFALLREQWRAEGRRHGRALSINWPIW